MRATSKPVAKGRKLNLAQDMDMAEMISISWPLWDTWNTFNAKVIFCERMKAEMYTREEYRICAEIMLESMPKHQDYGFQALKLQYETRTGKELTYNHITLDLENAEGYYACYLVSEMWQRRQIMMLAQSVAKEALVEGVATEALLLHTQKRLAEIDSAGAFTSSDVAPVADRVHESTHQWEAGVVNQYISTGFSALDRALGGFPKSEMVALGGMSGAGKTALLCNMTLAKTLRDEPVLVFSAEMTSDSLLERMAAIHAQKNVQKLRFRSGVTPSDYETFRASVRHLRTLPIAIDDTSNPTLQQIESRILTASRKPEMVFVDYLEKVDVGPERSEELRVSMIAQGLKTVAKKTGVCIVALSQYARDKDAHRHVPKDSWLRYSGKIEQEAAMIVHWWWPGYFVRNKGLSEMEVYGFDPANPDLGTLMVTKNRFGRAHSHRMVFNPELLSFYEYESDQRAY